MEEKLSKSSRITQEKILRTATKLFAQKGFSGTRVKDIAGKSNISQALIYYNFKSKKQILELILEDFKQKTVKMFIDIFDLQGKGSGQAMNQWLPQEIATGLKFFSENRDILSILIFESLKQDSGTESLVRFWDVINQEIRRHLLSQRGFDLESGNLEKNMVDLFYIFIPVLLYSVLGQEWVEHSGAPRQETDDVFSSIMNKIFTEFYK